MNREDLDFYKGKNVLITGHTGFKVVYSRACESGGVWIKVRKLEENCC